MKWSSLQTDVFDDVAVGTGHTIIEAVAGSGKTTVIIESINYIPDNVSWLLVAFNKKIADELKIRASYSFNGDIRTLHSLGLKTCKKRWPNIEIDNEKVRKILDSILGKDRKLIDLKYQMRKCISLCKGCLASEPDKIDLIIDQYDIDIIDMKREDFICSINKTLLKCYETTTYLDFDDMLWFVHMYDLPCAQYDYVFTDESQDLNESQLKLVLASVKKEGRIFMVGDSKQAIYFWSGATEGIMDRTFKELNAKRLPLSVTYRCPINVVNEAKKYVSEIEARPNAPDGIVEYISYKEMLKQAQPGCFVLSRVNAPLIKMAMHFILNDVPCNIQGRDLGSNLGNMIKKSRKKTIDSFLDWLQKWEQKEMVRLHEKGRPTLYVTDKAACLRALADGCNSVGEMKSKIAELFEDTDDSNVIMLSSVHRAKGLQRDVVYLLNNTFFSGTQEELNIKYVAITRSANKLYYVTDSSGGKYERKRRNSKRKY